MKEYDKKYWVDFLLVGIASALLAVAMVGISLVLQYGIDLVLEGHIKEAVRGDIVKKILRKSYLEFGKHHASDYLSLLMDIYRCNAGDDRSDVCSPCLFYRKITTGFGGIFP